MERVNDVRLEKDELRIECRHGFDIRCHRSVIDDPEGIHEAIELVRSETKRGSAGEEERSNEADCREPTFEAERE